MEYYSFTVIDDGIVSYYSFSTPNTGYTVYFNLEDYSNFASDYPALIENGYGFGFFPSASLKGLPEDRKVLNTIKAIIDDFYKNEGHEDAVLIYHCDDSDGKSVFRNKLFDKWEKLLREKENVELERTSFEIERHNEHNQTVNSTFIGIIYQVLNSRITEVRDEFESFAINLANEDKP